MYHFLLNLTITLFSFLYKNKNENFNLFSELKENLLKASIVIPFLWITTHIALSYRDSIEYLHILFLSSKILYFSVQVKPQLVSDKLSQALGAFDHPHRFGLLYPP